MFNRWGHQKDHEKMWRLKKCCIVQNLKENLINISHVNVFFVSFSKESSNTLLRFAESQWGEKQFGLADNNFNCYQTVLECLGTVSYKTDYFIVQEIVRTLLLSVQRDGVHYNVSLATRSSFIYLLTRINNKRMSAHQS